MQSSNVILVDEHDNEIGVMEKMQAHEKGLLHRAFSIFIINDKNEMLLQKRALSKYHSPGLWTNACCSHPHPNEKTLTAANRRLREEMGFICPLTKIGSFTYHSAFDNGLTEHEFDHVFAGVYSGNITSDPREVKEYKWLTLDEIDQAQISKKEEFTVWFHLAYPLFKNWIQVKSLL